MKKQRITKLIAMLTMIAIMLTMLASCEFLEGVLGISDNQGSQDDLDSPKNHCWHTEAEKIVENNVEPTCTTIGSYDSVVYCVACRKELSRTTITTGMVNHSYIDGCCGVCGKLKETIVREGDYIYFGEYPQTIKADDVTITETQDSRGYYLGSDGCYYDSVIATPYDTTGNFTNGTRIVNGKIYYFKVEPIRWRILTELDGTALVLCDNIIANMAYQSNYTYNNREYYTTANGAPSGTYANNYKYSTVRNWLINEFYNMGFTESQREIILTTRVDNHIPSPGYSAVHTGCEDTYDKIFLLSEGSYAEELNLETNYNSYNTLYYVCKHVMHASDYSRATGVYFVDDSDANSYENGSWWTRTPHSYSSIDALYVNSSGFSGAVTQVTRDYMGVVPALQICLNAHSDTKTVIENNIEPTCIKTGSYDSVVYCLTCGEELLRETVTVEKNDNHNYVDGYCSVCRVEFVYALDGNYIYFGEYPQTIKADDVTITDTKDARGYYLGSDGYYYAKVTSSPYSTSTMYIFSTGEHIKDATVYYFKVEPIRWRILSTDGETAFILCDSIIANHRYIGGSNSNNYAKSEIRQWLNETFFETAFSEFQREIIRITLVDNSAASTGHDYNVHACEDTEDMIFLLSVAEISNSEYGFSSNMYSSDVARQLQTSDYSRATGASMNDGIGLWWLRSPVAYHQHDKYVCLIGEEGKRVASMPYEGLEGGHTWIGVVPAMWIDLRDEVDFSKGLVYELNRDKESYSVIGIGTCTDSNIIIPSKHYGLPVTSIDGGAFHDCDDLTSVVIPDSVTSIGSSAFYGCSSLTSVSIGNGVTSIGSFAFEECKSLTSLEIPDSVTSIGNYAFNNCTSLTSVSIGNGVTSIGDYAFYWCTSLTSVSIGNSVTSIGSSTFSNCRSLTSVVIPDSVTSIGNYVFHGCTSLTSVVIPDSVTSIGDWAFADCTSLTSLSIGNSVTNIGDWAFESCDSLTSVVIPDSVTSIGDCAFESCDSLTSVLIPDSVTSIGDWAFFGCPSLTSVVIGNSVTSIGDRAFYWCDSLTSVVIGNSVTSIGDRAFYWCYSLTSIIVDENNSAYKSIDGNLYTKDGKTLIQYAIGKSDTSFTIPNSVTSIGDYAFYDCDSLISVVIPGSVTSIGGSAFSYCDSLTSVSIGNSATSIGSYAFSGCSSLTSVVIPDSVTSIGSYAFSYCSSLTSVVIPDSVTSIGDRAFYICSSLKDVYYTGSEEDWAKISIGSWNSSLTSATKHYNHVAE